METSTVWSTMAPTGRLDRQSNHVSRSSPHNNKISPALVFSLTASTVASGATSCTGTAYDHLNGFSSDRLASHKFPLNLVSTEVSEHATLSSRLCGDEREEAGCPAKSWTRCLLPEKVGADRVEGSAFLRLPEVTTMPMDHCGMIQECHRSSRSLLQLLASGNDSASHFTSMSLSVQAQLDDVKSLGESPSLTSLSAQSESEGWKHVQTRRLCTGVRTSSGRRTSFLRPPRRECSTANENLGHEMPLGRVSQCSTHRKQHTRLSCTALGFGSFAVTVLRVKPQRALNHAYDEIWLQPRMMHGSATEHR